MKISIVTIDQHGQPAIIETVETLTLPDDVIIMNPGIPPVLTDAFDDYLRAFKLRCQPPIIFSLEKPDTAHQPVQYWRP